MIEFRHLRSLLILFLASLATTVVSADEGWVIERFDIALRIHADGSITADESLDVDFRNLSRHGIFREIVYLLRYDETHDRKYDIRLTGVTDSRGRRHQVDATSEGSLQRFRIGDPNRTISGKQTYRIAYTLGGALNGFGTHDELYWNASGTWPVRINATTVTVSAPMGAIQGAVCFQGTAGSTENCAARFTPDTATFAATRPLEEGEQFTIVTGLRKGVISEPRPVLHRRAREFRDFFDRSPALVALTLFGSLLTFGGVGALWWRLGRDRRYISLHYLTQDAREETLPLFGADPIVVEFEPPEKLRPGQMGLLIDERADTLDVTATIIDLAVRGYLTIAELPKEGWFGRTDWELTRLKEPDAALLPYERIILRGLFDSTGSRMLSDLKNKFHDDLQRAKDALYTDALTRGWFPRNPKVLRVIWALVGVLVAAVGAALTITLGAAWGAGLVGVPVIAGGLFLVVISRGMPRRTAAGREAMRRTLGFARYLKTAETHQQAFAERANIFTQYLPYAIAFGCVDKWATAFKDIDLQQATARWYVGGSHFDAHSFSSNVGRFSSSVSSTIASTPGGSGGSGFSGGSSGGGGGGGGGGSW